MIEFFQQVYAIITRYWQSLLLGVQTTLIVALTGTVIGLLIGLIIGGLRAVKVDQTSSPIIKVFKSIFQVISSSYIGIFRGTPMMVQAVFIYYAFLNVVHWTTMQAAIVVISINTGAYMAEIIRSGIQSVDKGQMEAARSLGLSNMQAMRYVILPQAIRNAFPSIGNEFIVNIKDSSVLMIISITELMFQARSIAGTTYRFTETYFIEAMIYLILTTITSIILNLIEKRMSHTQTSYPQSITIPENIELNKKQKGD
ncbi:MAG: amino acid ABC transporter permease [Erysipelotrichaceae bacterium]|nr:amino acid ABC transporter permease [Erysipelotrichaceae bacterium]MDY6034758.1 amino acid ABC transporter permease [Bulleidia sp.]